MVLELKVATRGRLKDASEGMPPPLQAVWPAPAKACPPPFGQYPDHAPPLMTEILVAYLELMPLTASLKIQVCYPERKLS